MVICGTGINPQHNVEARVARNAMEIDCGDGCDNYGDGFADGAEAESCATKQRPELTT